MKFTVLRGFCLGGGIDAMPGDVIDLENADQYIRQGRVKPAAPADDQDKPKTRKGAANARN